MELKSIKLKDCIFEVDTRNTNLEVNNLLGVTINKVFIPSVANINGTDLSKYKIINKNQFVCGLMQVSRDEGVAIALYKNDNKAIVSPAYYVFEVLPDVVIPEYLELIFCSSEFDREATFNAVGGVRGTLTWEDFCNIEINLPSLDEQKKFVHQYNTITNRIDVLKRLNENLFNTINVVWNNKFSCIRKYLAGEDADLNQYTVTKMKELYNIEIGRTPPRENMNYFSKTNGLKWVSIADMNPIKHFISNTKECLTTFAQNDFKIKIIPQNSVLLSFKMTIGRVLITTENMYSNEAIASFQNVGDDLYFLYMYLKNFDYVTLGNTSSITTAVNSTIVKNMLFIRPSNNEILEFNRFATPIFNNIKVNEREIERLNSLKQLLVTSL